MEIKINKNNSLTKESLSLLFFLKRKLIHLFKTPSCRVIVSLKLGEINDFCDVILNKISHGAYRKFKKQLLNIVRINI